MTIDWAQAFQIGGVGFLLVFAVLAVLSLATWLIDLLDNKIGGGSGEAAKNGGDNGGE